MALPGPIVGGIALLALGYGISRALSNGDGKPAVPYEGNRPLNAAEDPGYFGEPPYSEAFTPVTPDSAPGQVFFGFQTKPDPIDTLSGLRPGDLVTVVLVGDATPETEGRRPALLGYFEVVTARHPDTGTLDAGTYDLVYRGIANENSDMAHAPKPSPQLELHALSPEYVGSLVGHKA